MAQNFLGCDRDQAFLLPPSVDDWLPADHFARFVIAVVEQMDLSAFYADYRADGHGRPAHDPAMMVALLVYAYARGQRSSRVIERACIEDIAFRVIAANRRPDHCTIARFRQRHETALAGMFGEVLALCAQAGLAGVAVLAVDGTKVHANASERATRDYEQLARELLEEAAEIDAAEDERFGDRRGDELPGELASAQGRKKWLADAKRRLDAQREQEARPIPASRPARVKEAKRRLEEELRTECAANAAYEAYRARGVMKNGRRFGSPPKPYEPPERPTGKINVTDPDSRNVKTPRGWVQGYNAQAVCNEHQIVLAAEISVSSADFGLLGPMITAAEGELAAAGISTPPDVVLGDAGYWHGEQMDELTGRGIQVLIPPDGATRRGTRPGWNSGRYAFMRRVLEGEIAGDLYRRRQVMVEPIFADTKFNRGIDRFPASRAIGRAIGMATDHRHRQPAQAPPPPTPTRQPLTRGSPQSAANRPRRTSRPGPGAVYDPITSRASVIRHQPPATAVLRTWPPPSSAPLCATASMESERPNGSAVAAASRR
jgi:transposase